jgi:hypothetical protein
VLQAARTKTNGIVSNLCVTQYNVVLIDEEEKMKVVLRRMAVFFEQRR